MRFASQQDYEDYVKKYGADAAAGGNRGVKKGLLEASAPQPAAPKQTAAQERLAKVKAEAKAKQDAAKAKQQAAVQAMKQRAADRAAAAARTKQERQAAARGKLQQAKTPAATPATSSQPDTFDTPNKTIAPEDRGPYINPGRPGGMKKGGAVKESAMMKKEGRGMAKASMQKVADKAVKGHEKRMHKMASGGLAAGHKSADGIAKKGKTRCKVC
jgi:colicin import membrane protein